MKGLVYAGFVLNKNYFIAAGIVAAVGTAFVSWLGRLVGDPETSAIISTSMLVLQGVVMAIADEYLDRDLEKNIKSRFADYALAGMSKAKFVMAELLKNVISTALAFVLAVIMQLVFMAVNPGISGADRIPLLAATAIILGLIDWIALPLVVYLKSAEQAGLIIGIAVGFGVVMPLMILFNLFENGWIKAAEFLSQAPGFLLIFIFAVLMYALFYLILLNRVRKGDVC